MHYRRFGRLDWEVSALGFGAMRLPTARVDPALEAMRLPATGSNPATTKVEVAKAIEIVRHAVDQGVNYIDTAYPYHDGESEVVLGQALEGGYREKVRLATKIPCWLIQAHGDFDKYLNEQLARLRTDRIDVYLLHALWSERWAAMQKMNALEWAESAIADGRIGHFGFSFHGTLPLFKEIIDSYDWDVCQVQYNFLDQDVQAGTQGIEYAAARDVAVVIMEPLMGGALAKPPPGVDRVWEEADTSPVDLSLRWLWNRPEISVVLSGMSTMAQLEQNLAIADRSGAGTLTKDELSLIANVREAYKGLDSIPCTKCEYCLPCPSGVNIPRNFELYNQAMVYGNADLARSLYNWHFPPSEWAKACTACKECEEKCPQQIIISDWMPRVQDRLAFIDPT